VLPKFSPIGILSLLKTVVSSSWQLVVGSVDKNVHNHFKELLTWCLTDTIRAAIDKRGGEAVTDLSDSDSL